ncbi:MAG: hypothetical protein P4L42_17630 [Desulfocapsaceae bacterium]|nr:hypothetical protein [Desulfocapsaceae bacterium]
MAVAAICLGGISACSPYVYNQEISGFSTGVNATVASYQSGQQSLSGLVLQDKQADYVKAKTRLTLQEGCLDANALPPGLPECGVVPFSGDPSPFTQTTQNDLRLQAQVARAAQVFNALKIYAAALTAVTNAADDTSLKQASQDLGTAMGTFSTATAAVAPEAPQTAAVIDSATNLIGQGLSGYLDEQRYRALKASVPAMDVSVAAMGKTMTDALLSIRQMQLAHMADDMISLAEPFETGAAGKLSQAEYQDRLTALESKVAAFNQARAGDPRATISALVEAHRQLAAALTNDTGQAPVVLNASLNFAVAAEQLNASLAAGTAAPKTAVPKTAAAGTGAKK